MQFSATQMLKRQLSENDKISETFCSISQMHEAAAILFRWVDVHLNFVRDSHVLEWTRMLF